MSLLLHGDCLEQMKGLDDNSVDLIFCDLPYGQTSCKWDIIIPWEPFWKEIMRVKKLNTPIFFTTTTKFGVELISNAPKKCFFRYDLVWVKTAPAGFLCAKKMPMRKHEMVYVFYEKLPFYDLSSHKHKFIKTEPEPVLVAHNSIYNNKNKTTTPTTKHPVKGQTTGQPRYDPPLPVSVISGASLEVKEESKEGLAYKPSFSQKENADNTYRKMGRKGGESAYDPPLPTSVVKPEVSDAKEETYKGIYSELPKTGQGTDGHSAQYDPPLPTSMLEIKSTRGKHSTEKPVALMEWILKYYSKEGDVVLDPTMGSGSTGVACKNMNRNFIGIEKDSEIYQVAVNRID